MSNIYKFLGLSIRSDYLSYSLIFDNRLFNLGSISIKSDSHDYFSKLNSVISLIKSEVSKESSLEQHSSPKESWSVGIYHDPILNKRNSDLNKLYKLCRIKTIVECSSILNLGTSPIIISDSEMCKAIAKFSDSKILNIDDVIKFATGKLSNYLNCTSNLQFNSIATSWATSLTLQRRINRDSLVLSDKDTTKIQDKLMSDKIINELMTTLNNADSSSSNSGDSSNIMNSQEELKSVLKRRIHKLVEEYIDHHY